MQDYPKLLFEAKKVMEVNPTCLVVTFPRFMAWSPVKNDYERAAILKSKTGFEESPRSGEADIMELFRKQLLSINDCPVCNPMKEQRIIIEEGAHICLWPECGVTTEELHKHIGKNVVIKKGSVLIVRCHNWYLNNVEIDGCLILGNEMISQQEGLKGSVKLENVKVCNKGWHYYSIDKDDMSINIIYRMRGYMVNREESYLIDIQSNGEFVIATVDGEGRLLYGIRVDGSVYQCATDDLTQAQIDALNKTIAQLSGQTSIFDESGNTLSENPVHVISNEEFVIATVDAEDKLLYGIRKDGSVYQCAIDDLTQTKINELSNTLNNEFSTKLQELSDKIDRNWVGVEYNEEEGQINAILGDDSKIKEVTVDEDGNIVFTQLIN